jgi:phosphatidylglycerol:prolipoprotein diacylglycerol transferase
MIPVIFEVGGIPLNSFGLMMVCCFLAAWKRFYLSLERAGEDPNLAEPIIAVAAFSGLVGSRLNYLATNFKDFLADPVSSAFGGAGFVFYGGFFFAALATFLYLKKHKKPFLRYADIAAPAVAIGYAVGRIGCHLSGDGDYGTVTDSFMRFSYYLGVAPTPYGVLVHPTPIYESLIALAIATLLVRLQEQKENLKIGALFGIYLCLSAVARFGIEFLRVEPRVASGLTEAQFSAMGILVVGLTLIFFPRQKPVSD